MGVIVVGVIVMGGGVVRVIVMGRRMIVVRVDDLVAMGIGGRTRVSVVVPVRVMTMIVVAMIVVAVGLDRGVVSRRGGRVIVVTVPGVVAVVVVRLVLVAHFDPVPQPLPAVLAQAV